MTNLVRYDAATGSWVPFEDTSTELGYAERTTNATTTNNGYPQSLTNKISGLSVTVVGAGLPVLVEFFCGWAQHSVSTASPNATLIVNGSLTGGQLTTVLQPGFLVMRRRVMQTAGTSYTYEVGMYGSTAGTTTYNASTDFPMHLSVSR